MGRQKRVYVSVPRDKHLDERQRALKHAVLERLGSQDVEPQEFHVSGLPVSRRMAYTFDNMTEVMARSHGALVLALARWRDPTGGNQLAMPTVWNHYEGALAVAYKKELLVITEEHVAQDGITWDGAGQILLTAPSTATPAWLDALDVKRQFDAWVSKVKEQRDLFLGYSSKARHTANDLIAFLGSRGVTVRNWELDFSPGATILDELREASKSCLGAIMLLTKDDNLLGEESFAAPRDNVIFEMGMFMESKGRERVLVIREEGAKMPADIGGGIYLPLRDRSDITPIQARLIDFIDRRL